MARAFSDRRAGASISAVAQRLGMPPGGMRRLLRNRVYLGELRDGEFANRTAHPAIVDRETFDAVQDGPSRPARSIRGPALLAGLVRCSGCGHVMSRQSAARVVYGCAVRHSGERCPSPASVTATLLEAHVEQVALAELERLRVSAGHGHRLERAMQRVTDAEAELRDYLKMVNPSPPRRRASVSALRRRARSATGRAVQTAVLPFQGSGADVWPRLDVGERNALLRGLLAGVIVARAGGRGARAVLADRVRVLAFGTSVRVPVRRRGAAMGIVPIPLDDLDGPDVLGFPRRENGA